MDCMQYDVYEKVKDCDKVSIPQAVWIACNIMQEVTMSKEASVTFQYRKRYGLHAIRGDRFHRIPPRVSIPQAVWIACNPETRAPVLFAVSFQYRKRYGLHAINRPSLRERTKSRFNTASGMDCMQYLENSVSILIFSFNTASGMDCMQ